MNKTRSLYVLFLLFSLMACFAAVIGIRYLQITSEVRSTVADDVGTRIANGDLSNDEREKTARLLTHDFGIVAPGTDLVHEFIVTNTTEEQLTVDKIHTACDCTVTDISAKKIPSGGTLKIAVKYKAPIKDQESRQRVVLLFTERGSPMVMLEIKANVRSPLWVSSDEIVLHHVGRGFEEVISLDIYNYSDKEWGLLHCVADVPWIKVECSQQKLDHGSRTSALQKWKLIVKVNTTGLSSGKHEGLLVVSTDQSNGLSRSVAVSITVSTPVQLIPAQLLLLCDFHCSRQLSSCLC